MELKPCPFCGSSNIREGVNLRSRLAEIYCDECRATVSDLDPGFAVNLWNSRPQSSAVKVKPLQWEKLDSGWSGAYGLQVGLWYEVKMTDIGSARIRMPKDEWKAGVASVDEAKATAQADYDDRIRSCLVLEA